MIDFWIILVACLVSCSCSLLGCFLVLRKTSMLTDAISHAVLPGIVIMFLLSGSKNSFLMIFGASLIGLLTTFLIEFLSQRAKVQADASIGVVFTFLFSIGIILVTVFADQIDLDQDCILYGEILYVPLDMVNIFGDKVDFQIPNALLLFIPLLVYIILFIKVFYKQLLITTFDNQFATTIGISATFWHYALMTNVSITTVASFESVGAILVIALFVVPPASAYLLSKDLKKMLFLSCVIGVMDCILGYYLSYLFNCSTAGAIATVAGIIFMIILLYTIYQKKIYYLFNIKKLQNSVSNIE